MSSSLAGAVPTGYRAAFWGNARRSRSDADVYEDLGFIKKGWKRRAKAPHAGEKPDADLSLVPGLNNVAGSFVEPANKALPPVKSFREAFKMAQTPEGLVPYVGRDDAPVIATVLKRKWHEMMDAYLTFMGDKVVPEQWRHPENKEKPIWHMVPETI